MRLTDESVVVQNIKIQPHSIQFKRQAFHSVANKKYGFDRGDFGADLRPLIIGLKYCGNMSEPKIGEFLANFNVQVSSGSISNILAQDFEPDYQDVFTAGLSSTPYQQTDDTSARVRGAHPCNDHIKPQHAASTRETARSEQGTGF